MIEHKTNQCPFCYDENETLHHIFECPKHNRTEIWATLQTRLTKIGTMPAIQGLLKKYFEGITPSPIQELTLTDRTINQAIQAQEKIGIRRVRLGHLSSHWNSAQERYIESLSPRGPENGSQWALLATKHILQATRDVWKSRNTKLHEDVTISQANTEILLNDIDQAKQKLQQLPSGPDNPLLTNNIQNIHTQNISNLKLWKKTYENAVQVSLKSKPTTSTIQTSIRKFF